ncbi:hypothetical protein SAMN04490185_2102 [Pseudomonas frederiksbergensis]|uniref:Uncharacterized protein n=1 Tax=Pseudomonas frederiksbergensis TaxID=104087 RepID=A0A1H4VE45_9PSED|nr:hypothetical protein [Pseudomonas frederiksbergensis]SEC79215.1 hypothetical protein SAMN04490185_2102 [Pseudomonas frederiksbergensis]
MSDPINIIDYRDEFYLKLYRRWLIVSILGLNRKKEQILTIQKGAFFDFLIKNPKIAHAFLVKFNRLNQSSPIKETLYSSNIDYGASQEHRDFLQSMLILERNGFVHITKSGQDFFVSATDLEMKKTETLTESWKLNIELLKPVVGKSLNVLQKSILGD